MFCGNCGAKLEEGDVFCTECGARVTEQPMEDSFCGRDVYQDIISEEESVPEKATSHGKIAIVIVVIVIVVIVAVAGAFMFMTTGDHAKAGAERTSQVSSIYATDVGSAVDAARDAQTQKAKEKQAAQTQVSALPGATKKNIFSITATSYLYEAEYNIDHKPENLIDGSLSNAWVEGVDGAGIGETVTLNLNTKCKLSGLNINAGYQKNEGNYYKNSRPKELEISFSDGTYTKVTLEDACGLQKITLDTPVETEWIKIKINSVYEGTDYDDTCISEIDLF